MSNSQIQESTWISNVLCHIHLSKNWYVIHMKSHGRWEQDTLPLGLGDTICVICCKVWESLSGLKSHVEIHKNFSKKIVLFTSPRLSVISASRFARLLLVWKVGKKVSIQMMLVSQEMAIICEDEVIIIYIYIYIYQPFCTGKMLYEDNF